MRILPQAPIDTALPFQTSYADYMKASMVAHDIASSLGASNHHLATRLSLN